MVAATGPPSARGTYRATMRRRVGIIGLEHETNTFRSGETLLSDFTITRGDELLRDRGKRTYLGGMLDGIEAIGAQAVPLMAATAVPSGVISAEAYAALRDEAVRAVAGVPFDALALQLHGAGVADGIDDLEADLGIHLRAVVGRALPIVGSLDLHANLTPATLAPYDALSCVKFYPHVDMYDRGREAVEWLPQLWAGVRFQVHVQRLPWLLLPTATSVDGPAEAIRLCDLAEGEDGVVDATFVHGFPLADGPPVGCAVLVTTEAGRADARAIAQDLARQIWALRDRFDVPMYAPREAVEIAAGEALAGSGPVVLAETSDNPGGGGVGDATHLLRAMIDGGVTGAFASILDPRQVQDAHAAGVGATIDTRLGGHLDPTSGDPIEAQAEVRHIGQCRYTVRGVGWDVDLGPSAVLRIADVDVIVVSGNQQVFDDGPFTVHGIDVRALPVVGLKSANHFREYYRRIARRIVPVLAPGLSHQSPHLPWTRVPRPSWPLDPDAEYPRSGRG